MINHKYYTIIPILLFSLFFLIPLFADPVSESLKSSPWYDYNKKDYHIYTKDDIKIPKQKKRAEKPRALPTSGLGWFVQNIVSILITLGVSLAIIALIYFIYKYVKNIESEIEPTASLGKIDYHALPQNLKEKVKIQGDMTLENLKKNIQQCIQDNKMEDACIYIYLFVLLNLQSQKILTIQRNLTAREYLKKFIEYPGQQNYFSIKVFQKAVQMFEYAMYKEAIEKPEDVHQLWADINAEDQNQLRTGKNK